MAEEEVVKPSHDAANRAESLAEHKGSQRVAVELVQEQVVAPQEVHKLLVEQEVPYGSNGGDGWPGPVVDSDGDTGEWQRQQPRHSGELELVELVVLQQEQQEQLEQLKDRDEIVKEEDEEEEEQLHRVKDEWDEEEGDVRNDVQRRDWKDPRRDSGDYRQQEGK